MGLADPIPLLKSKGVKEMAKDTIYQYYDLDLEWFKSRKYEGRAAIVIGILSGASFRTIQSGRGCVGRAVASHPKIFEPVVHFIGTEFPSKINSATGQEVKSGGRIYKFRKKYLWHISGREKVNWIVENMGSTLAAPRNVPSFFPPGCCKSCGADGALGEIHDQECYGHVELPITIG